MRCLDASFIIDLLRGDSDAVRKANSFDAAGERTSVAAPALAEILSGAYYTGGPELTRTLETLASVEVLPVDEAVAAEAGRIGGEMLRRGAKVATVDLLIAATATLNQHILVTRDAVFSRIPGLAVESY
jgi:predicted nucleic acid-binding protein